MNRERNFKDRLPREKKQQSLLQRKQKQYDTGNNTSDRFTLFLSSLGNERVGQLFPANEIQAKLNISSPGDFYEQQADQIAEQMLQIKQIDEASALHIDTIQGKSTGNGGTAAHNVETGIRELQGKGSSMSYPLRDFFEPRLGVDLGNVRIHTGENANALARSVNARAFTYQNEIVFGNGQFQPGTTEGRKLIGHELVHTVQQGGGLQRKPLDSSNTYYKTSQSIQKYFMSSPAVNMEVLGASIYEGDGRPFHYYNYLIKGSSTQWKNFLEYINSPHADFFPGASFWMFVKPFLTAAVNPGYTFNFVNYPDMFGQVPDDYAVNMLPVSKKITDDDIMAFLNAVFVDGANFNFDKLEYDSVQALTSFISKYGHLVLLDSINRYRSGDTRSLTNIEKLAGIHNQEIKETMLEVGMQYLIIGTATIIGALQSESDETIGKTLAAVQNSIIQSAMIIKSSLKAYRNEKEKFRETAGKAFDMLTGLITSKIPVKDPLGITGLITGEMKEKFLDFIDNLFINAKLEKNREIIIQDFRNYINTQAGLVGKTNKKFAYHSGERFQYVNIIANSFGTALIGEK